jgi:hypothetical protein
VDGAMINTAKGLLWSLRRSIRLLLCGSRLLLLLPLLRFALLLFLFLAL